MEVSEASGLGGFIHVSGSPQQRYILESMSAGAAFFDYDDDGWLDLFVVNGTRVEGAPRSATNRLYRNESGTEAAAGSSRFFRDVTEESGLRRSGWGMGCAVADYDNDGDEDLYVTYWGSNVLCRNKGDGTFVDVTQEAGVGDAHWGTSAAFGDLDGDGHADLYVANYVTFDLAEPPGGGAPCTGWKGLDVFCGPHGMGADPDVLYRNNGDGTFSDVTAQSGIDRFVYPALGVVFVDFDADGDLDLYVANDSTPNLLLRNDGDWRLTEVGPFAGLAYSHEGRAQAGMGVDAGDYDNDGDADLFVTNFSDDVNTLYRNDGGGVFEDATHVAGVGGAVRPYLGWSTALADFDNDGWLDLFVANGHLYPQLEVRPLGLRYRQRNLLYWNDGGLFRLDDGLAGSGLDGERVSRGAAFGDYDNDGDIDVLVVNLNDRLNLLRNDGGNRNNWLGLELIAAGHRGGEGSPVRLISGDLDLVRQVKRAYGYLSSNDERVLFGLGGREQVDRIEVHWPTGYTQIIERPPVRRYLVVRERREPLVAHYNATAPAAIAPVAAQQTPDPAEQPAAAERTVPADQSAGETGFPDPPTDWSALNYHDRIAELYRQSRHEEALYFAHRALQPYPREARLHYAMGVTLYSGLGRYEEAAAALEQAIRIDSTMIEALELLGAVYLDLDQPEQAAELFERAALSNPEDWELHYRLGLARNRLGDVAVARTAFERAIAAAPGESMPYLHLARTNERLGLAEAARAARRRFEQLRPAHEEIDRHRQAVRANPDRAEPYNGLGLALAEAGRLEEARILLEKALECDAEFAKAHNNLANVLQRLGDAATAIEHYCRALQLDEDMAESHYGMGMSLHSQGMREAALRSLRRAIELRPDYIKAHINLGILLDKLGRAADAVTHFRRAVDLAPGDARAANNLVIALTRAGRFDEAQGQLERTQERQVDLPLARKTLVQALVALAQSHAEEGALTEAIRRQRQAIDLTPSHIQDGLLEQLRAYEAEL